jgi:hypothetical protein
MKRKQPNLFIVGAAKAGTTSLAHYLSIHPNVYMSPIKEPNYFCEDISVEKFDPEYRKDFSNNTIERNIDGSIMDKHSMFIRSDEDYQSLYESSSEEHTILGEASVSYLFSKVAAQKIAEYNPKAKIIIVLREPVSRAYSHYLMDVREGLVGSKNFYKTVYNDYQKSSSTWGKDHLYIELGLYYNQIKRYFDLFPRQQIMLFTYENFIKNPEAFMEKIHTFLEIKPIEVEGLNKKLNEAKIPKSYFINKQLRSERLKKIIRSLLPSNTIQRLKQYFFSSKKIPVVSKSDREKLFPLFKEDLNLLETNFDISFEVQNNK